NHVVYFFGVESGNTCERFSDRHRSQIVGPRGTQGSFKSLSDRSTNRRNNHGFWHVSLARDHCVLLLGELPGKANQSLVKRDGATLPGVSQDLACFFRLSLARRS